MVSAIKQLMAKDVRCFGAPLAGLMAGAVLATVSVAPVLGASKTAIASEAIAISQPASTLPLVQPLPPPQVEVVIVWGFRLRSTEHDLRVQSITSGYRELVDKAACINAICGFVVVKVGAKWQATNVMVGSETELREIKENMEREGTTLVIVHPTGTKRSVPQF